MGQYKRVNTPLEKGDSVQIREYVVNPDFWDDDGDMFSMIGQIHTVESQTDVNGIYRLKGHRWTWRRKDLILMGANLSKNYDPNYRFRMKKRLR